MPSLVPVEVEMVRWPDESERVERLRSRGVPRLLLLDAEIAPPPPTDCLEDWIRMPAVEGDIAARTAALGQRAAHTVGQPEDTVVQNSTRGA